MARSSLVIENKIGQVVRTIHWEGEQLVVFANNDTGRIDFVEDIQELESAEINFTVLGNLKRRELITEPFTVKGLGQIRLVEDVGVTLPLVSLTQDNPEEIKTISKWTAISHAALLLLLLLSSLIIKEKKEEETPVVAVFKQIPEEAKKTVKASEKKILKPQFKAKVADRTVKPKHPVIRTAKKVAKIRTQVNLSQVGALGALGGMTNGKVGSAGFNINATNSSLGTSSTKIGSGGVGGYERAIHGQGLVGGPVGTGGPIGTGGYATRGQGGGRPGYGKMSMVGGSSGYFLPLEDEALIEGGLDKDQIAAVIQRHLGEVIYCYEQGLQSKPKLNGRVGIHFVIGGSGRVNTALIQQSSLNSTMVEGCIVNKLRNWKFPQPVGGVNVKVTYPFVLRRVG